MGEDLSSSNTKLEDVSSQDLSSSHDDSLPSHNDSKNESQPEVSIKTEKETDPKYAWMDRSRTSEEFELSLEINDKEFLETVKKEYRSSSPSWANQKFKFPVKKEKSEKKIEERVEERIEVEGEKNMERSVSVRKRMQDEIKKEKDEKSDKLDIKEEKSEAKKAEEPNINTQDSLELLKLKGESLRRKDRQYRSSKDDLNTSNEREGSKEERRREHRSGSKTLEKEDDKGERRKKEKEMKNYVKRMKKGGGGEKLMKKGGNWKKSRGLKRTKEEKRKGWRNVIGRIVKRGKLRRRRENVLKRKIAEKGKS